MQPLRSNRGLASPFTQSAAVATSCKTGCCTESKAPNISPRPVSGVAYLPAVLTAFLAPAACPCCWATWGGIITTSGLGVLGQGKYVLPITAVCMAIALVTMGWQAHKRSFYLPLLLAVPAAILILAAKTTPGLENITIGAAVALLVASV